MKKTTILLAALALISGFTFTGCGSSKDDASGVLNMVFVPASEKGDENDFSSLLANVNRVTG